MKLHLFFALIFFFSGLSLSAQEKKVESKRTDLMVLLGKTSILGGDLNKHLKSQSLEEKNEMSELTFEWTRNSDVVSFGGRLNYMELYSRSTANTSDTAYMRSINYLLAFRSNFIDTEHHQFSLLLAGGLSWVELNLNQSVGVTKYDVTALSIEPAAQGALTYSVGFDVVGFVVEGGYSWNEFKSLRQHEKFYSASLNSIDLSGWYVKTGLTFHIR